MLRKFITALLAAVFIGGLAAPNALASHKIPPKGTSTDHENLPTNKPVITEAKAHCTVDGQVALTNGLSGQKSHDHFAFSTTQIICTPADPTNPQHVNLAGAFDVNADGGTDGHDENSKDETHGEDCESGYSHSDGYSDPAITEKPTGGEGIPPVPKDDDQNKGDISVARGGSKDAIGWVKFVRVGSVVEAWGWLDWDADGDDTGKKEDKFVAELNFTPNSARNTTTGAKKALDVTNPADVQKIAEICAGMSKQKINGARLQGVAVVGSGVNLPQENKP